MKNEWSLILFTLLTQIAVGSFIVVAGLNIYSISKAVTILPREFMLNILYIILALVILAMISSFLHLGKPRNSFYALTNIGSSWLSREILFVVLFVGAVLIYTFIEYTMMETTKLKSILTILGLLFGLFAVFSMAKLYKLETVPAWNSFNTFIQFYSTAIILGILNVCLTIFLFNSSIFNQLISCGIYRLLAVLLIIFITLSLLSFLYHLWLLSSGGQAELESFDQIINQNRIQFYSRIVLSVFSIIVLIYQLLLTENIFSSHSLILLAVLMIIHELIGRYLFYASYKRIGV